MTAARGGGDGIDALALGKRQAGDCEDVDVREDREEAREDGNELGLVGDDGDCERQDSRQASNIRDVRYSLRPGRKRSTLALRSVKTLSRSAGPPRFSTSATGVATARSPNAKNATKKAAMRENCMVAVWRRLEEGLEGCFEGVSDCCSMPLPQRLRRPFMRFASCNQRYFPTHARVENASLHLCCAQPEHTSSWQW